MKNSLKMNEKASRFLVENIKTDLGINENQRITLNVGGLKHEASIRMLNKIPSSRLGKLIGASTREELSSICDDHNLDKLEFYFDRDPTLFNYILNYYRSGHLHISDAFCPFVLQHELIYWKIPHPKMDICCEEKVKNNLF